MEVEISRTGYTGDLGYEIWMPWNDAPKVWDALIEAGRPVRSASGRDAGARRGPHRSRPDPDRVDYTSSKKALIESQKYSPYEIGLGRLVDLKKEKFIGREALEEEQRRGPKRLADRPGNQLGRRRATLRRDRSGPASASTASRVAVPVYRGGAQIGKATSTTWSPALKE